MGINVGHGGSVQHPSLTSRRSMYHVRHPDRCSCLWHQCGSEEIDVGAGVEVALVELAVDMAGEQHWSTWWKILRVDMAGELAVNIMCSGYMYGGDV